MREILFRGKTDKGKWVQGVPFFEEDRCYIIEDLFICDEYDCTGAVNTMVIPETVGQYTGLTDKYGKKIFEGDIIQSLETKETAVVQWFPEHSAFMVCCKSSNEVGFLYECTKIIEVIGNIHDNPELLERSDNND